ncbi:MAG TPA: GNAT family N-acetyltransferase [Myxococcales bacterium]
MQADPATTLVAEELDRAGFDALAPAWDAALEQARRPEPFYRHHFLSAWLDHFAPEERLRVFVAREQGRLVAALPLVEDRPRFYGVKVRRLRAPANVHSNRFDLLLEPGREDALKALWSHLRASAEFDVLEIPDVPEQGAARKLLPLAEAAGLTTGQWESMRSPYVPLEGGWTAVSARLDARFRQNMRRRRRKLEQRGPVELERVEGGRDLERYLEEGFELERAGWKGRESTAIASDPVTRGFYAELARREATRGRLSLYFLRLSGRAVAFQFGLADATTYWLPKTGYDESLAECSPGQLLAEAVLRDCAARGLAEFDFLGPAMSWKSDWTAASRVHDWLYVFGTSPAARWAHRVKFGLAPAVREVLRWKP